MVVNIQSDNTINQSRTRNPEQQQQLFNVPQQNQRGTVTMQANGPSTPDLTNQGGSADLSPKRQAVVDRLKRRFEIYRCRQTDCVPRFNQTFNGVCEQQSLETSALQKRFFESKAKRAIKKTDKKQSEVPPIVPPQQQQKFLKRPVEETADVNEDQPAVKHQQLSVENLPKYNVEEKPPQAPENPVDVVPSPQQQQLQMHHNHQDLLGGIVDFKQEREDDFADLEQCAAALEKDVAEAGHFPGLSDLIGDNTNDQSDTFKELISDLSDMHADMLNFDYESVIDVKQEDLKDPQLTNQLHVHCNTTNTITHQQLIHQQQPQIHHNHQHQHQIQLQQQHNHQIQQQQLRQRQMQQIGQQRVPHDFELLHIKQQQQQQSNQHQVNQSQSQQQYPHYVCQPSAINKPRMPNYNHDPSSMTDLSPAAQTLKHMAEQHQHKSANVNMAAINFMRRPFQHMNNANRNDAYREFQQFSAQELNNVNVQQTQMVQQVQQQQQQQHHVPPNFHKTNQHTLLQQQKIQQMPLKQPKQEKPKIQQQQQQAQQMQQQPQTFQKSGNYAMYHAPEYDQHNVNFMNAGRQNAYQQMPGDASRSNNVPLPNLNQNKIDPLTLQMKQTQQLYFNQHQQSNQPQQQHMQINTYSMNQSINFKHEPR